MELAGDLLDVAEHLALYQGANPTQAALRRAVSTAYYAIFHLLIHDAADRWSGSPEARTGFMRAFEHTSMKKASDQFERGNWVDWNGNTPKIPETVRSVARAFVNLQNLRHKADYSNDEWTADQVNLILEVARKALDDWNVIRHDPLAGNYLAPMLLKKRS